jgi:hypothetical protein
LHWQIHIAQDFLLDQRLLGLSAETLILQGRLAPGQRCWCWY